MDDIYDQVSESQLISTDKTKELKELELQIEYDVSLPLEENIELCKELIGRGEMK